ncbi:MAG: hypothetical protein AAF152_18010 [Cyanobacteria bacterium P01_A01_bin.114]
MNDFRRQFALDSLVIFTGIALGLASFATFSDWSSTQPDVAVNVSATAGTQLSAMSIRR